MGDRRSPGRVRTWEYGRTIQNPLFTMSAISTRRKTWCSAVDAWLPRAIASSRCCSDQGAVVKTTGAPFLPRCWSNRRAGCGNRASPGLVLVGLLWDRIKDSQVSSWSVWAVYEQECARINLPSSSLISTDSRRISCATVRGRFAGGWCGNGRVIPGTWGGSSSLGGLGGSSPSSWRGPTPQALAFTVAQ